MHPRFQVIQLYLQPLQNDKIVAEERKLFAEERKSIKKTIRKQVATSFNKKLENMLTQLAGKGINLDKDTVVGEEDEEYEESEDEGMEDADGMESEDEGIDENDHDEQVLCFRKTIQVITIVFWYQDFMNHVENQDCMNHVETNQDLLRLFMLI